MSLQQYQQELFELLVLNQEPEAEADPYVRELAGQSGVALVQDISRWWTALLIEQFCRFSVPLLKTLGIWEQALKVAVHNQPNSPFPRELALSFLKVTGGNEHAAVASLAQFEAALMEVSNGSPETFEIEWTVNPYHVLGHVSQDEPLDLEAHQGAFLVTVSNELDGFFQVSQWVEEEA